MLIDFLESLVCDVRINLGGGNGGVPEERLNAANVSSIKEEVCGKAVAEGVGMNVFDDACLKGIVFNNALNRSWGKAKVAIAGMFGGDVLEADKERFVGVVSLSQVSLKRFSGGVREEDKAHLVAFSANTKLVFLEVDVVAIEAGKLRHAHTSGEEKLKDGAVAKRAEVVSRSTLKEAINLLWLKKIYCSLWCFGNFYLLRSKGRNVTLCEVLEEAAQGNEEVILCFQRQHLSRRSALPVEKEAKLANRFSSDGLRVLLAEPREKLLEIGAVIAKCQGASSALYF